MNYRIMIHGSALSDAIPRDIDVIVTPGALAEHRAEIEAKVQDWASEHLYNDPDLIPPGLPLDIQEYHGIPQLPFSVEAPYNMVHNGLPDEPGPARIVQWDLAAWVRACEKSETARLQFQIVYANLPGKHPRMSEAKVTFCDRDGGPDFTTAYTGGGRKALATARDKCPVGYEFIMGIVNGLPNAVYQLVAHPTSVDSVMRLYLSANVRQGSPSGSGMCYLTAAGIWTDHGALRTWESAADDLSTIGKLMRRLGLFEREVLAGLLAREWSELGARMKEARALAESLFKLTLYGQAATPQAAELRAKLSMCKLTPEQWKELEGLPMRDLMIEPGPHKITLYNASILTAPGNYSMREISPKQAHDICEHAEINSAIGHAASAEVLTEILGIPVQVDRKANVSTPGDVGIVLKMNGRPAEGVILDRAQMDAIGYTLYVIVHTR